jgi:deoxyribonuclease V
MTPSLLQARSQTVMERWPDNEAELITAQLRLALEAHAEPSWELGPSSAGLMVGGCFLAFARGEAGPGAPGDRGWAAAVAWPLPSTVAGTRKIRNADSVLKGSGPPLPRHSTDVADQSVITGRAPAPYQPGLLALREGPLLEEAVRSLADLPDVLLVDATGQDHPRRAGLAVHLGAKLDRPSVGVTDRPLLAQGDRPAPGRGATSPLSIDGSVVAYWVRTRSSARPVVAHAGWRTTAQTASDLVLACSTEAARTPVPLLEARRTAREARAVAEGRVQIRGTE